MVEHAFINIENYLEFFKEIDEIYKAKDSTLKTIIAELEEKFANFFEDKPKKQDEFLIPEIPKFKKEVRDKRESSRACKRNPSVLNGTTSLQNDSSVIQNDSETIRRSSRLASKTKLKSSFVEPQNPIKLESGIHNNTYVVSPSHPPSKIRRTNSDESKKSDERRSPLEESVCTADMKQPLGASTPTSPPLPILEKIKKSPAERKENIKLPDKNTTPTSNDTRSAKGESVKKRIEEFEKRAKGHLLPSKLPVKTPEKNKISSSSKNSTKTSTAKQDIFTEDESGIREPRTLRANSKVLQEKNTNVKLTKEKASEAQKKKTALMKASVEENKRKREERGRKVAAQREAAEKEKQLAAMKLEKEKEEKLRLHQKMKDEKLKEETLRRKQIAALKAAEMEERKKQEEAVKLAKLKKQLLIHHQVKEDIPQYSIGSILEGDSSEDEENPKRKIPSWAKKEMRDYPLNVQAWLNKKETVYPWFYNKTLKYPKLEELFSTEVKTRPRTSSAFWNSRICFNESFPIV